MKKQVERPYDAEVEYLENNKGDDSCQIDTGFITSGHDNDFFLTAMSMGEIYSETNLCWISSYADDYTNLYRVVRGSSPDSITISNGVLVSAQVRLNIKKEEKINIEAYRNGIIKVNDKTLNQIQVYGEENQSNLILFKTRPTGHSALIRIYSLKWIKGDKVMLDLIPVRVGKIGAFFNKVNGDLLFAQIPESLVLGPDIF